MEDDGFEGGQRRGGRKNPKMKDHKETILVTAAQAAENKKKKKQQNAGFMYGNVAGQDEEEKTTQSLPATQFEEEKQSKVQFEEPEKDEKKKKNQGKRGGKKGGKGKGKNNDSDEEEGEEQKQPAQIQQQVEEEKISSSEVPLVSQYPKKVVYCASCDVPPEYCCADKKDFMDCVNWLCLTHPDLYDQIYNKEACSKWMLKTHPKMFQQLFPEDENTTNEEEKKGAKPQAQGKEKKKKKVGFGEPDQVIKIYKAVRRGKKLTCSITGMQAYGVNLKDMAKLMSKKFASNAAHTTDDKYGECIQVQGDIQARFFELMSADLQKYSIPEKKIVFEEVKKKKATTQEPGDDEDDQE